MLGDSEFNERVGWLFTNKEYNLTYEPEDDSEDTPIDEFDFTGWDIVMCRGDGYRGKLCYDGFAEKDGKKVWIDAVAEATVRPLF